MGETSVEAAQSAGLRYVSDTLPGIRRRRAGSGFVYVDANAERLRDALTTRQGRRR